MNWASSLGVVESTANRLVVVDLPWYLFGILMLLASLMVGRAAWPVKGAKRDSGRFQWLAIAFAAPLLLFAVGLLGETRLTLDRTGGQMELQAFYAGIPWRTVQIPLDQAREAFVEYNRAGRGLSVMLHDGKTVSMGFYSSRTGYNEVATEINRFLGRREGAAK